MEQYKNSLLKKEREMGDWIPYIYFVKYFDCGLNFRRDGHRDAKAEIAASSSRGGLILGDIVYSGEGEPSTLLRA